MSPGRATLGFLLAALASLIACQRAAEPAPERATAAAAPATLAAEWIDFAGLEQRITAEHGRVVVVNFWATWCEPCREEFPGIVELQRRYGARGLTVLSLSLDAPSDRDSEVRKFLAEQRPSFPVFIKTAGDPDEFINAVDPKWTGSLPATLIYDRSGERRQAIYHPLTLAALEDLVEPLLRAR